MLRKLARMHCRVKHAMLVLVPQVLVGFYFDFLNRAPLAAQSHDARVLYHIVGTSTKRARLWMVAERVQ